MTQESAYQREANRRWPQAEWIDGDGGYATLSTCNLSSVSLWPTRREAAQAKRFLDRFGCGGHCRKNHSIVDLHKWGVA